MYTETPECTCIQRHPGAHVFRGTRGHMYSEAPEGTCIQRHPRAHVFRGTFKNKKGQLFKLQRGTLLKSYEKWGGEGVTCSIFPGSYMHVELCD